MSSRGIPSGPVHEVLTYLVTNLTVAIFSIVFFVLNRTKIIGREHVGEEPNTLFMSHHQSLIDSFLVGACAYYPKSWIKPSLMPWNPAAEENYYKTPLLAFLADKWKCIPVREGRRDLQALRRMAQVLPKGTMILFPEGTRSRDGSVGPGRAGAGLLVLSAQPKVIPVAIDGMDKVLPIGCSFPRFFKRITVSYGAPVDYSDFLESPRTKETAQALMDRVMDRIRTQKAAIRHSSQG